MFPTAPRPELLALLAAAKSEPEDDTPKLVLADWLQEQDHPADHARGEYLRTVVGCKPRGWHVLPGDRLRQLAGEHGPAWFGRLAAVGFQNRDWFGLQNEWGLPFPNVGGTNLVKRQAAALADTEEYAWVAGLRFIQCSTAQFEKFAAGPLYRGLAGLTLHDCNAWAAAAIANSPGSASLRKLVCVKTPVQGAELAGSPHLAGLRHLLLSEAGTGCDNFAALCNSPHLNELRVLEVLYNDLWDGAGKAFAEGTGLPALTELATYGGGRTKLGAEGMRALVSGPRSGRLRKLDLWVNDVTDAGVEALCATPNMCNLTHLNLDSNKLTNRAAVALAGAEHLKTLRVLNLNSNTIGNAGALALAASPHLGDLRFLGLGSNRIGEKPAAALRDRFGDRVAVG